MLRRGFGASTAVLLRARSFDVELDFDQQRPRGPRTAYLPLSATTAARYCGQIELLLCDEAKRRGFRSQFWISRKGLENFGEGAVLPHEVEHGVQIGLGFGPLKVYNVADIEATDLHFFLQQNPLPADDAAFPSHLLYVDGRWGRFRHPGLKLNLDHLHSAVCTRVQGSVPRMSQGAPARNAAKRTFVNGSPELLAALHAISMGGSTLDGPAGGGSATSSAPSFNPYSADSLNRDPPRRWIHADAVKAARLNLTRDAEAYDPVGVGGLLYNAEQTNRTRAIEAFWHTRLPEELRFVGGPGPESFKDTELPPAPRVAPEPMFDMPDWDGGHVAPRGGHHGAVRTAKDPAAEFTPERAQAAIAAGPDAMARLLEAYLNRPAVANRARNAPTF